MESSVPIERDDDDNGREAVVSNSQNADAGRELIFFKLRKNWTNAEVTLPSKLEGVPIADGIIFLPFATSAINDGHVGEENAGVLITSILESAYNLKVERDLPGFCSNDPSLV
ncbi:hypothetical protein R1flu_026929 [Riccia fluitans]|uniref:Uncharacterized protein n=1 Tax=Riccia fluitans TaxID=41844 RepID=A0ABD1XK79_9MARC